MRMLSYKKIYYKLNEDQGIIIIFTQNLTTLCTRKKYNVRALQLLVQYLMITITAKTSLLAINNNNVKTSLCKQTLHNYL